MVLLEAIKKDENCPIREEERKIGRGKYRTFFIQNENFSMFFLIFLYFDMLILHF